MATAQTSPVRPAVVQSLSEPAEDAARRASALLGAGLFAIVLYAAAAHGGLRYPYEMRVEAGLAILSVLALAGVLFGPLRARAPRAGVAGIVLLVLFAVWSGVTLVWSVDPDATWVAANRALAYTAVLGVAVVLGASYPRAVGRAAVAAGVFAALIAGYALLGKLGPGLHVLGATSGGLARLRGPLDDSSALALVCAMGIPPLLSVAVGGGRRARPAALAGVWLLVLAGALTYSRGGIVALVAGIGISLALGGARLRSLIHLALALALAAPPVWFALSRHALAADGVSSSARESDGGLLALIAAGALLVLLVAAAWVRRAEPRFAGRADLARRVGITLAALLLVAVVALGASAGSRGVRDFRHGTSHTTAGPHHLVTVSGGDRWRWWRESAGALSDRPLKGWGAGSFVVVDRLYRTHGKDVRRPYSVPMQFLAETGVAGAVLGLGAIVLLLAGGVVAVRARPQGRDRAAAAALLGVAGAWTVHGLASWDWDIPGVTVAALAALGILLGAGGAARADADPRRNARLTAPAAPRALLLGLAALAACAAVASAVLPGLAATKAHHAVTLAGRGTQRELRRGLGEALYASRLDPLAAAPLVVAAGIHIRAGDVVGAGTLLARAVARQPNDLGARRQLLLLAERRNDPVAIRAAATGLLALDPSAPGIQADYRRAVPLAAGVGYSPTAVGTPLPAPPVAAP